MTTMAAGYASALGIKAMQEQGNTGVKSLQDIHADITY